MVVTAPRTRRTFVEGVFAVADAVEALASAVRTGLRSLGKEDAAGPLGAVEFLGVEVGRVADSGNRIAEAIQNVANAIETNRIAEAIQDVAETMEAERIDAIQEPMEAKR